MKDKIYKIRDTINIGMNPCDLSRLPDDFFAFRRDYGK